MADSAKQEEPLSGKFHFSNGATYDGEIKILNLQPPAPPEPVKKGKKDDTPPVPTEPPRRVRHGKGVYMHGGYTYEGEWYEDAQQGHGKFSYASGCVYDGLWHQNKYNGLGTFTWTDGRKYEGEWQDSKVHGKGVYTDAEGHQWSGQFFNGAGPGLTCQL